MAFLIMSSMHIISTQKLAIHHSVKQQQISACIAKLLLLWICKLGMIIIIFFFPFLTWDSTRTASPHVVQEVVVGESSRREGDAHMSVSRVEEQCGCNH